MDCNFQAEILANEYLNCPLTSDAVGDGLRCRRPSCESSKASRRAEDSPSYLAECGLVVGSAVYSGIHGHFYVFVDECHRTQGGDINQRMKCWMGSPIFVGFTVTTLLRKDRQTTMRLLAFHQRRLLVNRGRYTRRWWVRSDRHPPRLASLIMCGPSG